MNVSCKSRGPGAGGRQRPRRRHRALSILDASTTEKVILEDAAPLINTVLPLQEAATSLFCCLRFNHDINGFYNNGS